MHFMMETHIQRPLRVLKELSKGHTAKQDCAGVSEFLVHVYYLVKLLLSILPFHSLASGN
jgi:hypothetical protein